MQLGKRAERPVVGGPRSVGDAAIPAILIDLPDIFRAHDLGVPPAARA